jgi:hypothetical protein
MLLSNVSAESLIEACDRILIGSKGDRCDAV